MNTKKTVLILYPKMSDRQAGESLKSVFNASNTPVEEVVIEDNYDEVLNLLEKHVIPVVVS